MFVKICQNEVFSEERKLMKGVVIIQMEVFWVPIFRGEFDGWKFFGWEFPRGKEFSKNHFLHIMHLFLIFKKLSINIIRLSTKKYIQTHEMSRKISFP